MGLFDKNNIDSKIENHLIELGYKKDSSPTGIIRNGLTKIYFNIDNSNVVDFECWWITFDLKNKCVNMYNEYVCGGCLCEYNFDIDDEAFLSLDDFIIWYKENVEYILEEFNW